MHAFSHSVAHKGTTTAFTAAASANVRIPTSQVTNSVRWQPYQTTHPHPRQRTNSLLDFAQYTHGLTPTSPLPSSSASSSFTSSASASIPSSSFTFSCVQPTRAATLPAVLLSSNRSSGSAVSAASKAKAEERNRFAVSLVDSAVRLLTDIWTPAQSKSSGKSSKMSIEGLLCGPTSTPTPTPRIIAIEQDTKKRLIREATLPPTPASLPSSPMRDTASAGSTVGAIGSANAEGAQQQTHTPPQSASLPGTNSCSPLAQRRISETPETAEPSQQSCTQSAVSVSAASVPAGPAHATTAATQPGHLPLRTFVHEVLRRSRTSCSTLQTAMCYVEAARDKVSEVMVAESIRPAPPTAVPTPQSGDLQRTVAMGPGILQPLQPPSYPKPTTISTWPALPSPPEAPAVVPGASSTVPTPALPSPLLDPRRTFLAALILASKFLHDRAYSNKAWAKLSGLDAREIGRCERALGDALGWRLWVGFGQQQRDAKKASSVEAPAPVEAASDVAAPDGAAPELPFGKPMLKSRMTELGRERTLVLDADSSYSGVSRTEKGIAKAASWANPYHVPSKRTKQGSQPPTPALTDASSVISSASSSCSDELSLSIASLGVSSPFKIPAAVAATYPKPPQKPILFQPAAQSASAKRRRAFDNTGILATAASLPAIAGGECAFEFPLYPFNAAQHPHVIPVRPPWERADEIVGHA